MRPLLDPDTPRKDSLPPASHKGRLRALGKILAWTAGGFVAVVALALLFVTLWLTPSRLTSLINREASEWLEADVKASDVRFTIWSSFPHFCVEADSLRVTSRTLRALSKAQRDSLPPDAEQLLTTGHIHGSINLLDLLRGTISLRDLEVAYIDLNLVALNDSVSNFAILPPDSKGSLHVPRFTTNSLRLVHTRPIRYFSAATDSRLSAPLDSARLERIAPDRYRVLLGGDVSLRSGGMVVLRDFPFLLDGVMSTDFHPFSVRLSDFNVALADVKGKADLDLVMGDRPGVDRFSYSIDSLDLLSLLSYLPAEGMPFLRELKADVPVTLSARLTSPYRFSASTLPSVAVDFHTAGGSMEYDFGGQTPLRVSDILLDGSLDFDGAHPDRSSVSIGSLRMRGEGVELEATADVSSLTTSPVATADISVRADMASLLRHIRHIPSLSSSSSSSSRSALLVKGQADARANVLLTFPDSVPQVRTEGSISASGFSMTDPGTRTSVSADTVTLSFFSVFSTASPDSMAVADLSARLTSGQLSATHRDIRFSARATDLSADAGAPFVIGSSSPASLRLPLDFMLSILRPSLSTSAQASPEVSAPRLSAEGNALLAGASSSVDMSLSFPAMRVKDPSHDVRLGHTRLSTSLHPRRGSSILSKPAVHADSAALARLRHTPEYLSLRLPEEIRSFYATHDFRLLLSTEGGEFYSDAFPAATSFSGPDLSFSSDSLSLVRFSLRSKKSAGSLTGSVAGLRDFIVSGQPLPIKASVSIDIDTLSINQLARTYAEGLKLTKGSTASLSAPKPATLSAEDSTALLIPRNLLLHIDASAKETVYTNLHLYDLSTSVDVRDGDLRIPSLSISSDFGRASLGLSYASSDILALRLGAEADIKDIDLVRFFERFHTLLLMMPQMKNLSGFISGQASMGLGLWPVMYADVPSLTADIAVQGRDLKVRQDAFIRKVTRMLLIPTASDIHIQNMNVRASVHDNLLELYPFTFAFDRYRLSMQGINNLNGRLYYHVGVLDSPLHLPFGINVTGMFSHPHLRFGGAEYKVDQGAKVVRDVMVTESFNIIREAKYYLNEFVRKAAEADETPASAFGRH